MERGVRGRCRHDYRVCGGGGSMDDQRRAVFVAKSSVPWCAKDSEQVERETGWRMLTGLAPSMAAFGYEPRTCENSQPTGFLRRHRSRPDEKKT